MYYFYAIPTWALNFFTANLIFDDQKWIGVNWDDRRPDLVASDEKNTNLVKFIYQFLGLSFDFQYLSSS